MSTTLTTDPKDDDPLRTIGVRELCERTGLKRHTVYMMVRAGTIPHRRFGKVVRFTPRVIAKWLEERQ